MGVLVGDSVAGELLGVGGLVRRSSLCKLRSSRARVLLSSVSRPPGVSDEFLFREAACIIREDP